MAGPRKNDPEQRSFLYRFQHKHSFFEPNFSEIISLEIKNFRARLGKQSGQEQIFLWGNCELCVFYRRFVRGEEMVVERVFPRTFSTFLDMSSLPVEENLELGKTALFCDAKYNAGVTPLFLTLFPLMGKLGFFPFIISVEVVGEIYFMPPGLPVKQGDCLAKPYQEAVKEQTVAIKGKEKGAVTKAEGEGTAREKETITKMEKREIAREKEADGGKREMAGQEAAKATQEAKAVTKGETIAAEKEKATTKGAEAPAVKAKGKKYNQTTGNENIYLQKLIPMMKEVPPDSRGDRGVDFLAGAQKKHIKKPREFAPDSRYYKTYRLFFEYFFPEQPASKTSDEKGRIEK